MSAGPPAPAERPWLADAYAMLTELYGAQYGNLVRLAALLVRDTGTAEEVVQDSFVALSDRMHRLRDSEKTLSYLRATVINRSRSELRHRAVVERKAPGPAPYVPSAEHCALALLDRAAVVDALWRLPVRQREAVALRYYGNHSSAEIAAAMGISSGAVKRHTSRAMAALRTILARDP